MAAVGTRTSLGGQFLERQEAHQERANLTATMQLTESCACPQPQNKIPGGQGSPEKSGKVNGEIDIRADNRRGYSIPKPNIAFSGREENLKPVGRVEQGCRPIEVKLYLFLPIWCDAYDCCDACG